MALKQPILLLGYGQLGLMIAEAGARLGLVVDRYDPENACMLPGTSDFPTQIDLESALSRYAAISVEREAFPDTGLSADLATSDTCVARGALKVIPDRFNQKSLLDELNIPTAAWMRLDSADDFHEARSRFGDVVIKSRSGGYDGRGTWLVKADDAIDDIPLDQLAGNAIVEQMVPFRRELSIVGARNLAGDCVFFPLVRNHHQDGILRLTLAPAQQIDAIQQQAETLLKDLMERMEFCGVMAVELFDENGKLSVNEIAPRVHNSGHWTQEGTDWSQFALNAVALTDLPLPQPTTTGFTAMVNLIGVEFDDAWLSRPGVVHWYGKGYRPGRKLGHVNLHAFTLEGLRSQLAAWHDVLPDQAQEQLDAEIALQP